MLAHSLSLSLYCSPLLPATFVFSILKVRSDKTIREKERGENIIILNETCSTGGLLA